MPKNEGNAQGRHYTDEERQEDEQRNFNRATGRKHFEVDENQKAGGHSDKHLSQSDGREHEFRHKGNDDDINRHDEAQDEGRMQGSARSTGHQGGRNQNN